MGTDLTTENVQISLRAARVNAGMTIATACKAVGIGKDTLLKWEKNSGLVTPIYQKKFSEVYGMPVNCIFFG